MTRKRTSETKAEKLPKKKNKDSDDTEEDTTPSAPPPVTAPSSARRPTRASAAAPPAAVDALAASDPVNSIGVIPKPPKSMMAGGSAPAAAAASTEEAPVAETTPAATTPTAVAKAVAPAATKSTPWYYSTVFGIAFLLLFSNILTVGLWMQYTLEVDLEAREIALVANQDRGDVSKLNAEIVYMEEAIATLQQEVNESRQVRETNEQQLTKLNEDVKKFKKESSHWHREALVMMTSRNDNSRRVETLEMERNEWQSRAEPAEAKVAELEKFLSLSQHTADSANEQYKRAAAQVETLLEEMEQMNVLVQNLETEGNELRDEVTKLIKQKRKLREECNAE
mmetsp:Transcript_15462/g.31946  ORF Transcript_15462/g.31946 Transcript_15462/m.31946 type:complete len:339 (-) Transcript_15462:339-1355(-)